MNIRRIPAALLAAAALAAGGCGPNLQKAGGSVSVDGVPVSCGGTVMFLPTAGGRPANGVLAPDGTFTLSYEKEGDGLPAGEYKVVIVADIWKESKGKTKAQEQDEAMARKSGAIEDVAANSPAGGVLTHVVPPEYNTAETTPHKETVTTAGGVQQFKIDIVTKKKK